MSSQDNKKTQFFKTGIDKLNITTNETNILKASDVNKLLEEQDKFRRLPSVNIFGTEIDNDSLVLFSIFILIWIFLWKVLNIQSLFAYSFVFFILYIVISIFNIFNSATDIPDIETSRVQLEVQSTLIQGGLGIFILVFIFLYEIKINQNYIKDIYKLLIINLIITSLSIIIFSVKNSSRNIRIMRKTYQNLFNMGVVYFIMALYMIFLSITKNNF